MVNCTNYFENESSFSKPMPWIGLYIAAASLACAMLIFADAIWASRGRTWFRSRYFSLNATSLTIIAVASKLSVDLNTSMPGRSDQLSKLCTSIFICVSSAIFIPSIGQMGNTELLTNLAALVILIITIMVNLCIQLKTGVIYTLIPVHITVLVSMFYILLVYFSTIIALGSIRNDLGLKYERMQRVAMDEFRDESSSETMTKKLEDYLMKFSMMAHTGWPYMVLARSELLSTTLYICILEAGVCFSVIAANYVPKRTSILASTFCSGESDYQWSTTLVICMQFIAMAMGTGTLYTKIEYNPTHRNTQIEGYWTQWLVEIKQRPFSLFIHNKKCRKFVHHAKNHFCNFIIAVQIATVGTFKFFNLIANLAYKRFPQRLRFIPTSPSRENPIDLKPYVLYLEGEKELIESMMKIALVSATNYVEAGKKVELNHLIEFLKASLSHGFEGVYRFDSDQILRLDSEEPPTHCWSLPVVTMTSIAILLPDIDGCLKNKLLKDVGEGLVYVKIIEENLNNSAASLKMRKAADIVWEQVDIRGKRSDINLNELASKGNCATDILDFLANSAEQEFRTFRCRKEETSSWPIEAVALNSLYRICQTMLLDLQNGNSQCQTTNDMFKMLSSRICDILGACLTNLEHSIFAVCSQSTIDNMNEIAWHALHLFGTTEKVMELLDGKEKPKLSSDKLAFIDEWRCSSDNQSNHLP